MGLFHQRCYVLTVFILLVWLISSPLSGNDFELVLSVQDPFFRLLNEQWEFARRGGSYGDYYYRFPSAGTGDVMARWYVDGVPSGEYELETWIVPGSYASKTQYRIEGAESLNVVVSAEEEGWYSLGKFQVEDYLRVSIVDKWEQRHMVHADALRMQLNSEPPPPPVADPPPLLGLCIDDVGMQSPQNENSIVYGFTRLPVSLTYAVLPHAVFARESARYLTGKGSEVIVHQPMEPISSFFEDYDHLITTTQDKEEIYDILRTSFENVPGAFGLNNHMGSLVTQDRRVMKTILGYLQENEGFFLDSYTIAHSRAFALARQKGVLTGKRHYFIDGETVQESRTHMRRWADQVLYNPGRPLNAIGHVQQNTLQALEEKIPLLIERGIQVQPVSSTMHLTFYPDENTPVSSFRSVQPFQWGAQEECFFTSATRRAALWELKDDKEPPLLGEMNILAPCTGKYRLWVYWDEKEKELSSSRMEVVTPAGGRSVPLCQKKGNRQWIPLGHYNVKQGELLQLRILAPPAPLSDSFIRLDAVRLQYLGEERNEE